MPIWRPRSQSISTASLNGPDEAVEMLRQAQHDRFINSNSFLSSETGAPGKHRRQALNLLFGIERVHDKA